MRRILVLIILIFLTALQLNAQTSNVWAFGPGGGIDFNYSPPKSIKTGSKNKIVGVPEASIADCSGNLLFYTDGCQIWNRNHKVMPNGYNSLCDDYYFFSFMDDKLIIKLPGDSFRYLIIVLGKNKINYKAGIFYWTVDMRKDSGRGDAIDTPKMIIHGGNPYDKYGENPPVINIVPNASGGYWLLAKPDDSTLNAYQITSSGIDTTPVISKVPGMWYQDDYKNPKNGVISPISYPGNITLSHDGKSLLVFPVNKNQNATYCALLYYFLPKSGKVLNGKGIMQWQELKKPQTPSYAEFSPNDSLIYISTFTNWGNPGVQRYIEIYQIKRFAVDPSATAKRVLFKNVNSCRFLFNQLKLGPDGRIYIIQGGESYLSTINKPDLEDTFCQVRYHSFKLADSTFSGAVAPSMYAPLPLLKWSVNTPCVDSIHFVSQIDTAYFSSFMWYFGDGDSSTVYSPYHRYDSSGQYFVRLKGIGGCGGLQWYADTITVYKPPHPSHQTDTFYYSCGEAHLQLHSTAKEKDILFTLWDWGDSSAIDSGSTATHTYDSSGSYVITQTVLTSSCRVSITDTLTVAIDTFPIARIKPGSRQSGCAPLALKLTSASENADSLLWLLNADTLAQNSQSISYLIKDTGWYDVTLIAKNTQGCRDTLHYARYIYVAVPPRPRFTYSVDTLCQNL